MALYGIDFYGASRYGTRVFLEFDARPFLARDNGAYGVLDVTWQPPAGSWDRVRLVRNAFGVPVTPEDGVVLLESNSGPLARTSGRPVDAPVRAFRDTGLEHGRFQYYALYVYSPPTGEWVRAGSTTGLVLRDYGYSDRLWELLPPVYRTKTSGLLESDNDVLRRFLRLFGVQFDTIRLEYDTLKDVNDAAKTSGNLLPLMAQQYGQFFEPELGMKQMRVLLQNTVRSYRLKGTAPGVETFLAAVSGYSAQVRPLKNLILDYNTSSAEETIGQFGVGDVNSLLSRQVPNGTVDAAPSTSMRRAGIFAHRAIAAGLSRVRTKIGGREAMLENSPVTPGTTYTFSAYARSGQAGNFGARCWLGWLDAQGNYISEVDGTPVNPATGAWSSRPFVTGTAPPTAVYVALALVWTATAANQVMYWDMLQLEAGAAPTEFADARLIDVDLGAQRVNLVRNPTFAGGTHFWSIASGSPDPDVPRGTLEHEPTQQFARWLPARAGNLFYTTEEILVRGSTHTWSIKARGTGTYRLEARIANTTTAIGASAPFTLGPTAQRYAATFTPLERYDVQYTVVCLVPGVGEWDEVLAELGGLRPYFDGTTYAFQGDSLWEGTPGSSRSHYYPQRRARNFRMYRRLPEYTAMGSSHRLNYAIPLRRA